MINKGNLNIFLSLLIILLALVSCNGGGSTDNNMVGCVSSTGDNTVTLIWNLSTIDIDDLAGYKVYYGKESDNYSEIKKVDIAICQVNEGIPKCTYTVNLSSGRWYFAVTAYDTFGNESNYSNVVCKDI
ncbi:MAG: hypothetical protein HY999_01265 [Nitrospinae bacterium]|nr:hypothetical protein [Nitrospinota bacterium]